MGIQRPRMHGQYIRGVRRGRVPAPHHRHPTRAGGGSSVRTHTRRRQQHVPHLGHQSFKRGPRDSGHVGGGRRRGAGCVPAPQHARSHTRWHVRGRCAHAVGHVHDAVSDGVHLRGWRDGAPAVRHAHLPQRGRECVAPVTRALPPGIGHTRGGHGEGGIPTVTHHRLAREALAQQGGQEVGRLQEQHGECGSTHTTTRLWLQASGEGTDEGDTVRGVCV